MGQLGDTLVNKFFLYQQIFKSIFFLFLQLVNESIKFANKEDIVLIAGKGHEDYQILNDKVIYFDDRKIAYKLLKEKNKSQ